VAGFCFFSPDKAQADSPGCTAVNGFSTSFALFDPVSVNTPSGTYAAGDTVTITLTLGAGFNPPVTTDFGIIPPGGGAPLSISGTQNTTTVLVYTVPAAATGAFQINSSGPAFHAGSLSFMCGSTGSSRSSAAQQNATNAQVATANGQQVLQQTNDAIKLGVLSSFAAGTTSQSAQARLAAYSRVAKLEDERADLERELADRPVAPNDPERRALENRLALTSRNLDLARGGLQSRTMSVAAAPADGSAGDSSTNDGRKAVGQSGSFHLNGAALADFCGAECGPTDPSTTRWNGWFDGRLIGATDSIAQQSSFGFVGVAGADYKLMPWLALGLTVGTEAFNTKIGTAGANVSENGVSVAPYLGVRLDPNVFFSAFVGGTWLNYNTAPQPGTSGAFGAWRFMTGGSLTGVWRFGPWRLQPSVDIAYGSESQNGFTDSAGTLVPGQIVQYGRVRGGPEVGYRFDFLDWSLEPFVLARGNLDFATNQTVLANGQQVAVRGGGSGGAGGGFVIQGRGFNVRGDFVYDSIGVTGLDIWTGRLRAGWSF
jgi:hypothetical protein